MSATDFVKIHQDVGEYAYNPGVEDTEKQNITEGTTILLVILKGGPLLR
jgi:hypothetical protein